MRVHIRPFEIRLVAREAHVSAPTVRRALAGANVRPGGRERIARALRGRGLLHLMPGGEQAIPPPPDVEGADALAVLRGVALLERVRRRPARVDDLVRLARCEDDPRPVHRALVELADAGKVRLVPAPEGWREVDRPLLFVHAGALIAGARAT